MTLIDHITTLLKKDERLWSNDADPKLLKNKLIALVTDDDEELLKLLLSDDKAKSEFFKAVQKSLIFRKEKFVQFVTMDEFLPDSFTAFENKIGLSSNGKLLSAQEDVSLVFPYKDCILEGGQDKEDAARDEIFYNTTLAPDEIDRLKEPKVLTNWKRYDKKGENKVSKVSIEDNLIIKGNNLLALYSLLPKYRNRVKMIYIDPPFNTGGDSFKYNDTFNHSTWLTFMRNRMFVARQLLTDDGNIFIHIDVNESHYLKVLCDDIFGRDNFVEEIIWAYGSPSGGRAAGAKPVNIHDYLLHYSKNYNARKQNKLFTPYSEKYIADWFKYKDDDGRIYRRRMRERDANGASQWEKQYLDESKGLPLTTVWNDIKQIYADPRAYIENQREHVELIRGFLTQKPERLIQRIIEMASDSGDIVLDFHLGSGTTCAVAHKMGRQYVGIEQLNYGNNDPSVRLLDVIKGDKTGISKAVEWKGGGSFVYCELLEWNKKFIDDLEKAKTKAEIKKIKGKIEQEAFFRYAYEPEQFDNKAFDALTEKEQKKALMDMLDMNHLYVNKGSMNDATFKVSEEDKKLNAQFYSAK